jgi:hypothetical protein
MASSPTGTAWKILNFVTEDGDRVEINMNPTDRSVINIKLSEPGCLNELRHVQFPGYVDLSGVGYFKDEDDSGSFSVLVIPYVVNNKTQDHGKIAFNLKECQLKSKDIYDESVRHGTIKPIQ